MKKIVALIALLAAFPPLSTDMYLGALPLLAALWNHPQATINLTLVCFFLTYCCFLLVYGPLSDRFGRRPPLLAGLFVYSVASVMCARADSVTTLIIARTVLGWLGTISSTLTIALWLLVNRFLRVSYP